jgi:hypothetical protein
MDFTIFYAWQNDTAPGFNRYLIRDSLVAALKSGRINALIEDSPRLDPEGRNPTASAEGTTSVFDRIKNCAVFVADLTFVGATPVTQVKGQRKLLSNPNVLMELGYAASVLGWDRIVLVMNEAYGDVEHLTFEVKGRRPPIRYAIGGETRTDITEVRQHLMRSFEGYLRMALSSQLERVQEIIASLDLNCLDLLKNHADEEIFWRRQDKKAADFLMNAGVDSTFRHLIKLRLIRGNWEPSIGSYAYRWTYLGTQTLKFLGLRPEGLTEKRAS